ncbi:MAG: hypothetical protein AAF497_14895, partial [Planctomycetota bacterium]
MRQHTPHSVRYIDQETEHDKLYEVLLSTNQDRFFFIPTRWLNLLIVGILAYAQKKTRLGICYVVFLSNHAHLLIRTKNAQQVADFFCLSNSQIAKEVQRLVDWNGGIFTKRYSLIAVTDEPEAQEARLRYLMSQGVKEGLCPHPTKWPGVQSASALLSGSMRLVGTWVNRSRLYELQYLYRRTAALKAANRRKNKRLPRDLQRPFRGKERTRPRTKDVSERLELELSPLPCWDHLPANDVVAKTRAMVAEIEAEYAETIEGLPKRWRRRATDRSLQTRRPEARRTASVRPKVHAASKDAWVLW